MSGTADDPRGAADGTAGAAAAGRCTGATSSECSATPVFGTGRDRAGRRRRSSRAIGIMVDESRDPALARPFARSCRARRRCVPRRVADRRPAVRANGHLSARAAGAVRMHGEHRPAGRRDADVPAGAEQTAHIRRPARARSDDLARAADGRVARMGEGGARRLEDLYSRALPVGIVTRPRAGLEAALEHVGFTGATI